MTPRRTRNLLRALFLIFALSIGTLAGEHLHDASLTGALAGALFGLCTILADRLLHGVSLRAFSSATVGLLMGLVAARLLLASDVLAYQPEETQWVAGLVTYAVAGYLGMMLAMRSNRDEFSLIIPYVRFSRESVQDAPLLVDTSVLIDGRIAGLCATGFLSSSLVVPDFVVAELQSLADSQDAEKRRRGRRGFATLSELQRQPGVEITLHDTMGQSEEPVDRQLLKTAQILQARLLTKDTGLVQVARVQGVPVLCLKELEESLRPVIEQGEELRLALTRPGRETHQGVGYLADGTMIVVNHARQQIGKEVQVRIANTVATGAGHLFFAELAGEENQRAA